MYFSLLMPHSFAVLTHFWDLKLQINDLNLSVVKRKTAGEKLHTKIIYLQSLKYKNSAMKWVFECQINNIESRTGLHRYKIKLHFEVSRSSYVNCRRPLLSKSVTKVHNGLLAAIHHSMYITINCRV